MYARLLGILRIIAGLTLILIGIVAFFTPLTPGSWLVLVGLEMLGLRVAFGRFVHEARVRALSWWKARSEEP